MAASSLFADASPEFRLVTACCRWPEDAERNGVLDASLQQPMQWPRVLFLAQRHRVGGLVAHALATRDTVPEDVRRTLAKAQQGVLLANLGALRAQAQLAALLRKHSLPFAVLKGTPLAMLAYGNLALRQSRDIDLLVGEDDVPRLDALLQTEGYRRTGLSATLGPHRQRLWMRFRKHFEYEGSRQGVHPGVRLEVHWRTTDNRHLASAPDALRRVEETAVAPGVSLPVLSREELVLDLCTHGAGHAWFRLKWIADVASLLRESGNEGQLRLLHTARSHGLERPVLQALHLCHELFDLPLVGEAAELSLPVRQLLRIAARALLEEDLTAPTATSDFVPKHLALAHLLLRAGWRYRLEELRVNLASPSDWQQVDLPVTAQFLYPLLRLPLWVKRRWLDARSGRPADRGPA